MDKFRVSDLDYTYGGELLSLWGSPANQPGVQL